MAGVFLSYDREDKARAKPIAAALEKAGHSVWWDLHIRGGAQFAKAIEEALKQADAVVVLWSANSVDSAWVRDEAAAGRDTGRLVPVALDATEPPLGFRQYQTIDLTKASGRGGSAAMAELLRSIEEVAGPTAQPATALPAIPKQTSGRLTLPPLLQWALIGGAIVLLLVTIANFIKRSDSVPVVAVAAADNSTSSKQLARDLFVKLGMLPEQGDRGMRLVEARNAGSQEFDFLVEIGGSSGSSPGANLVLLAGEKRALLWSKDLTVPADRQADLKEQAAYNLAHVLGCAMEARNAGINIDDQLTKSYLEGCSILADLTGVFVRPAISAFLEVTRKEPNFEEGWNKLLITETQFATGDSHAEKDSPEKRQVRHRIVEVRKRYPNNAGAYFAEIEMMPLSAIAKRLELSEKAVRLHPDNSFLLQQRALHLFRVGRVREAVEHAWRASEADPLSARSRADYIAVLAYGGFLERAYLELAKGEKLWPGSIAMIDASSRVHQRFGDPRKALAIQRSGVFGDDPAMEAFLLARIDPSPANIDKALSETRAMFGRDPRALGFLMQALGAFGREDELYAFFARWNTALPVGTSATGTAGVLFRAPLRKFRQDPRFMSVAKRFGVLDYWQSSGKWPDFCFEPDLPYDCKAEAAKLRA